MAVYLPAVYAQLNTLGGTAIGGNGRLSLTVVGRGDKVVSPINLRSLRLAPPPTGVTPTFPGVLPVTFYYVVTAVNASGETVASNEISALISDQTKVVQLSWDVVTGVGVTKYHVWRSTTSGTYAGGMIAEVSGELTSSYMDTGTATIAGTFPTANTALRQPYNTFRTFTSMTTMRQTFGSASELGVAAQVAAAMGLNTMSAISVDFSLVDAAVGDPAKLIAKEVAYQAALDELVKHDTDLVVLLDPEPEISLKGKAYVISASDIMNKSECTLLCSGGMNSDIGDTATSGTLVYNSTQSFNHRLVSPWAPVDPYMVIIDDAGKVAEVLLNGSYVALAAAVTNALQPDEAMPITNKSFSVFTRFATNFNRADLQLLDPVGVSTMTTDANGVSTIVHGETSATDTVENNELNIVVQENRLLRVVRDACKFAIGQKNSAAVRLAVHDRVAQVLQQRVAQGLMTEWSGLEVLQDPSRPTYILVNFSHVPMYGVNVVLITIAFDTRAAVRS